MQTKPESLWLQYVVACVAACPLLARRLLVKRKSGLTVMLRSHLVCRGGRSGLILYRTQLTPGQLHNDSSLSLGGPVHDYAQVPCRYSA